MTGRRYLQAKVTGTVDKMHVKAGLDLCFSLPIIGQLHRAKHLSGAGRRRRRAVRVRRIRTLRIYMDGARGLVCQLDA